MASLELKVTLLEMLELLENPDMKSCAVADQGVPQVQSVSFSSEVSPPGYLGYSGQ